MQNEKQDMEREHLLHLCAIFLRNSDKDVAIAEVSQVYSSVALSGVPEPIICYLQVMSSSRRKENMHDMHSTLSP